MKLALLFLVVSLAISCSNQQRFLKAWQHHSYRPDPYIYFVPSDPVIDSEEMLIPSDVQARRVSPVAAAGSRSKHLMHLLPWYNMLIRPTTTTSSTTSSAASTLTSTSTSIVFTTVVSSATIANIQSCISSNQFGANNLGALSTSPCSRRRRSDDRSERLIANMADTQDDSNIFPSKVELMETSRMSRNYYDHDEALQQPEIDSSIWDPEETGAAQRQFNLLFPAPSSSTSSSTSSTSSVVTVISTVTTTSTITSYSFSTALIKRYFQLVVGNGVLACLPAGYSVC